MALIDYLEEQKSCPRCNACKWITMDQYAGPETQAICPSLETYQFHAYSGGGKLHVAIGVNENKFPVNESVAEIAYKCNLCGACDYTCKAYRKDLDVCESLEELRITCVEADQVPEKHREMMEAFKENDNFLGKLANEKIDWTNSLPIKKLAAGEKGDVFFYTGSGAIFIPELAARAKVVAKLLMDKGVDLVTAGVEEYDSAQEAFVLGHIIEGKMAAARVKEQVERSGAKRLVTLDAHSYMTMRYYFPKYGYDLGVEIVHITELLAELLAEGKLELKNKLDCNVTYHDPCYLGRRSEPYHFYEGPKDFRPMDLCRTGEKGVYDAPRDLLKAIPGVQLTEMDRIKGYAWCCGGGAGVPEAYHELTEFSSWERMREAKSTGAQLLVTACPTCEHILGDVPDGMKVADVVDLVLQSEGGNKNA